MNGWTLCEGRMLNGDPVVARSAMGWRHVLIIFASLIAFVVSAPALASDEVWMACESCDQAHAALLADEYAPPLHGFGYRWSTVYIASRGTSQVHKFQVETNREPGLYSRDVWTLEVEPEVQQAALAVWAELPLEGKALTVPAETAESAIDYIRNFNARGRVYQWLDEGGEGVVALLNALIFSLNLKVDQLLSFAGANLGPTTFTLVFSDGTRLKVEVGVGKDGQTLAPSLTSVTFIEQSATTADGEALPPNAESFFGYETSSGASSGSVNILEELAKRFGLEVIKICGGPSRFSCDATGRCTVTASC